MEDYKGGSQSLWLPPKKFRVRNEIDGSKPRLKGGSQSLWLPPL